MQQIQDESIHDRNIKQHLIMRLQSALLPVSFLCVCISTISSISHQHQVAPVLHICPPGCPSPCCSLPAAARSDSPTSPLTWPWRWPWWKLWLDRFLDKTWPSPRWKLWWASKLTCSISFCFTFCAFPQEPQCLQKPNRNHTFPGSQI